MRIGCHLSIAKGLDKALELACQINANTFQFFTRNPRGGRARTIAEHEINIWQKQRAKMGIYPAVGHLPYTVNAASPKTKAYEFAIKCLREDLERMDAIGTEYLVFHPGSFVEGKREAGIRRIVTALEKVLTDYHGNAMLLLETMAGRGTEVGSLTEIAAIISALGHHKSLGVCLDSCHLFAAGYDFRSAGEVNRLVEELDELIGIERVHAAHINDSKAEAGTHVDRHELIGKGKLGVEGLGNFVNHPAIKRLPLLLETPVDNYQQYAAEIRVLQALVK